MYSVLPSEVLNSAVEVACYFFTAVTVVLSFFFGLRV